MLTRILHPSGIVTWQSPLLNALHVPHAFSTRIGGISAGPFASLNLGNPAGCDAPDDNHHLRENYGRLQAAIAGDRPMHRAWVTQVHGNRIIQIEAEPEVEYAESMASMIADRFHGQIDADALLTDIPDLFLSVRIADCVPLLFADVTGKYVAAVHAGWRGVVAEIVARTVRAFSECDIPSAQLRVAIGPHISVKHFEIGPEVAAAFAAARLSPAIDNIQGPKPHINLQAAMRLQLNRLGIDQIDLTDQCTVENATDFYSHRRDAGMTGRMAALIAPRA